MRRVLTFVLLLAPVATLAQTATPRLRRPGIVLTLSPDDGHLIELSDGERRALAGAARDSVGLWLLDRAPGATPIAAQAAGRFTWRRTGQGLELTWDRFAAPATRLRVVATVRLRRDSTSAWRIRLDGIDGLDVEGVHFPRITGIAASGDGEELAVPQWMGQRTRELRRLLAGPDGLGRRLEWSYPGQLSLQALSFTTSAGRGLYLAADDTAAYRKSFAFWGTRDGRVGYDMVHVPSDPAKRSTYAPTYAAIVGVTQDGWFAAAERYRSWGTRQYWARESRLANGTSPAWVRETGIWVWNRGRSPVVLEPAAALQRDAGLPVSVFWHWWHGGPYDTSFPDYLPPREGAEAFTQAVAKAHEEKLHAIVYMNQRLWCVNTPSWVREGAERFAVRERDGTVRRETYNVFDPQPCAPMDIATSFWRDKYAGIAVTVVHQYGIDGLYMDQAVLSLLCWSPDHGHPVGGGHYWMDGFRSLARDLRRRTAGKPLAYAGEGGGESWLPDLDAFLTLQVSQERYIDPASGWEVIPFFQAVYHPYALTYGTYGSLTWPPYDDLWPDSTRPANAMTLLDLKYRSQYYLEQARMFVWGMQPTIANFLPEQLSARRRQIDYLEHLARLRYDLLDFFQRGTMLRAPRLGVSERTILMSRVSIYAARRGGASEATVRTPDVLSGAWRARDGRVALALASISEDTVTFTLDLDPSAFGLPRSVSITRHDATGRHAVESLGNGPRTMTLHLAPLQAMVLELRPRRQGSGARQAPPGATTGITDELGVKPAPR
ncbi:MAG: hypothetical protein IT361_05690 [Gemmatimonadaceae bacterium]|nr:hypothetical protein [Gemmatimonadaceae bacterium]